MLGFYNIIKPTGVSSNYVVSKVKYLTKQKVGHLGTLDPLASGVLPVAVGKATKLFDYFLTKDKKYFAIAKFGVLTDTLDSEGKIIQSQQANIKKSQIEAVLPQFLGQIDQIPPKYSSISINGQRSYELARQGKDVKLPSRKVNIYSLSVQDYGPNMFAITMHCSAGTYVRSLVSDIAKAVGSIATTVCIIRLDSGAFNLNSAYTLQDVSNGNAKLLSVSDVIDLPKLEINQTIATKLLNGMTVQYNKPDGQYLGYNNGKLLGIVESKNKYIKIKLNLWEETND